jgi:NTE family protein
MVRISRQVVLGLLRERRGVAGVAGGCQKLGHERPVGSSIKGAQIHGARTLTRLLGRILDTMSKVGLVLGGGGVTGAAFHFASLFALRMATGWDPNDAEVVVGTSSGAVVAAMLRGEAFNLTALVGDADGEEEVAALLADRVYRRSRPTGVLRWVRHGLLPGIRRPGVRLILGSPAPYTTDGIVEWLESNLGEAAHSWPDRPTIVVAYELEGKRRVAFGTEDAPDTGIATAVAASAAVPMVFQPVEIDGRRYVDGGIASGTSADLLLGSDDPLDLVVVVAPMAADQSRPDARFYEPVVDRFGHEALDAEKSRIGDVWPETEVLILRPSVEVLDETRPNPLSTHAAVPAFLKTLRWMRRELARSEVWEMLSRHLLVPGHR